METQVVILSEEYRLNEDEVYINMIGNIVMLAPKNRKWNSIVDSIVLYTDDYMNSYLEKEEKDE